MQPPNLSLIIVMVCFWLTFWLVQKFLLKPVGSVLAERNRRIEGAETEWQTKHQEYLDTTARLETELEEAARAAAKVRNDHRQAALDRRQAALDGARQEADGRLDQAMEVLQSQVGTAREELKARANELARIFASQLLGREVSS
jgi:F0F1-type ATP synthase membrane subunit b/b'